MPRGWVLLGAHSVPAARESHSGHSAACNPDPGPRPPQALPPHGWALPLAGQKGALGGRAGLLSEGHRGWERRWEQVWPHRLPASCDIPAGHPDYILPSDVTWTHKMSPNHCFRAAPPGGTALMAPRFCTALLALPPPPPHPPPLGLCPPPQGAHRGQPHSERPVPATDRGQGCWGSGRGRTRTFVSGGAKSRHPWPQFPRCVRTQDGCACSGTQNQKFT